MQYLEYQNQCALIKWCEINKSKFPRLQMIFSIPNGEKRDIKTAIRLKLSGTKSGVPDIFLAVPRLGSQWPHDPGAHGLFIEMKSSKGKLSDNQKDWIRELKIQGYQAEVCFDWTEAAQLICKYLGIEVKIC
jgi:hypothetical protein